MTPREPDPAARRPKPTDREVVLAEALVSLVDYTGRIVLTGLSDGSSHYVADKSHELAAAGTRVATLIGSAVRGGHPIRWPVVRALAGRQCQRYPAGRALFPPAAAVDDQAALDAAASRLLRADAALDLDPFPGPATLEARARAFQILQRAQQKPSGSDEALLSVGLGVASGAVFAAMARAVTAEAATQAHGTPPRGDDEQAVAELDAAALELLRADLARDPLAGVPTLEGLRARAFQIIHRAQDEPRTTGETAVHAWLTVDPLEVFDAMARAIRAVSTSVTRPSVPVVAGGQDLDDATGEVWR
jgi:hypothetical protein